MATILFEEGRAKPQPHPVHFKKQLLPNVVDGMAMARPQTLFAEIPVSPTSFEDGYRKVTYKTFANAVNGAAWWLTNELGPGKDFQTLSYMGFNDIRYTVMLLGAIKAGYKLLLTSPYNSPAGNINLFKILDCTVLLTTDPRPPTVAPVLEACSLKVLTVPSVDDLLSKSYHYFPYLKTFEEARNEPFVALHTSGTTGLPKPVIYTHDWTAAQIRQDQLAAPPGYKSNVKEYQGTRCFFMFPPFHASSMFALLDMIANQTVAVYPLPMALPSASGIVEALEYTKANVTFIGPIVAVQIATNPELLKFLSDNLEVIVFGGADLPKAHGDKLAAHFKFWNSNGATETGAWPLIHPQGEWIRGDWQYIRPHPLVGMEFRPIGDKFEAVIVRNSDKEYEQPVFKIFPDLQEFHTKDLFSPHPSKEGLWIFQGRADDIIVLANGQMCDPKIMEDAVASHPQVRGVVMLGTGKNFPLLLVELLPDANEAETLEVLWPVVEETNKFYQTNATISKSTILFVDSAKPLPRAAKGTIQREPTLKLYKEELDRVWGEEK